MFPPEGLSRRGVELEPPGRNGEEIVARAVRHRGRVVQQPEGHAARLMAVLPGAGSGVQRAAPLQDRRRRDVLEVRPAVDIPLEADGIDERRRRRRIDQPSAGSGRPARSGSRSASPCCGDSGNPPMVVLWT